MSKKLIASGEAAPATKQLTKACSDCPLRRDALNGWLGGSTPEKYARLCHSDAVVECHVHAGSRCAGLAIYRNNVSKWQPFEHRLPKDHETIFSTPMEFIEHHSKAPEIKASTKAHNQGDGFDDWFDTLSMHVLDRTGVEFKDKDSVREDYDEGRDVFDVVDDIVAEYDEPN